jgi:hypothetical protein
MSKAGVLQLYLLTTPKFVFSNLATLLDALLGLKISGKRALF